VLARPILIQNHDMTTSRSTALNSLRMGGNIARSVYRRHVLKARMLTMVVATQK
jgi:hypothetical protein